ncbi:MAG: class II fructose-bisphosphate aldolase [bacterium]|nr:class II fructose-bisphosphate aldolase [bacterium]
MELKEFIKEAENNKTAIGHFNISNLETLWGIFRAAKGLNVPVIIGLSEGEGAFVGVRQAAALVKSLRQEYDFPIFINADHFYSFEKVKEAVDADFDAAIFDGSHVSSEENENIAKMCAQYAEKAGKNVLIEGELGHIGQSSKLLEKIPEDADVEESVLTSADDARNFVEKTGVDLLAPAVGNLHGMLKTGHNPRINIGRIKEIREAAGVPLVLHGGSGISDEDFRNAIKAGVSIIHINTEIRLSYRKALAKALSDNPDEIAPYKYGKEAVLAVEEVVTKRLKLFNGIE